MALTAASLAAKLKKPGRGKLITFVTNAISRFDPTTGAQEEGSETLHQFTCSPPFEFEDKLIDGDSIRQGDSELILPNDALTFTPAKKQKVRFDAEEWQIVRIKPFYRGEVILAYQIQLRK